mmetsp:Transcript_42258/g.75695  ORF Transcript_42258/g.75695 Transcript_42258/m.75695 type:complete len:104 (-) Transcript_42258:48-359(-)
MSRPRNFWQVRKWPHRQKPRSWLDFTCTTAFGRCQHFSLLPDTHMDLWLMADGTEGSPNLGHGIGSPHPPHKSRKKGGKWNHWNSTEILPTKLSENFKSTSIC